MAYKGGSGQTVGIRLMLLRDYLNSHVSRDKAVPHADIMKHLENQGFKIDRKTLYTDIEALRTCFYKDAGHPEPSGVCGRPYSQYERVCATTLAMKMSFLFRHFKHFLTRLCNCLCNFSFFVGFFRLVKRA